MADLIAEQRVLKPSRSHFFWVWIFPVLMVLLFLFPLLLINSSESHYNERPSSERMMNLKGLELVTTEYLNEHPEAFHKLIRLVTDADDAIQNNEFPVHAAVMQWLKQAMYKEGFDDEMPVYYFLRTVYLNEWESGYFKQVDDAEREYLYDLMSAMIGGMYRCTCVPSGFQSQSDVIESIGESS